MKKNVFFLSDLQPETNCESPSLPENTEIEKRKDPTQFELFLRELDLIESSSSQNPRKPTPTQQSSRKTRTHLQF